MLLSNILFLLNSFFKKFIYLFVIILYIKTLGFLFVCLFVCLSELIEELASRRDTKFGM